MRRSWVVAGLLALVLGLAGCGGGDSGELAQGDGGGPAAGMCHESEPDCVDTVVDGDGTDGAGDDEHATIEEARSLLGRSEDELDESVRVGRKGGEHFALTEDYVIGRMTAELDEDGAGVFRVTAVTVELTEGPQTVTD
jgi:hypothetical protein